MRPQFARYGFLMVVLALASLAGEAQKRRFTVADDIGLARFGHPDLLSADPVTCSPNGRYFLIDVERGLLDRNRPESTLSIFRTEDVQRFLLHAELTHMPSPVWTFSMFTYKDGPIISAIRWLADSSGFAFLAKTEAGNNRLFLADLKTRTLHPLTPGDQHVTGFDIRSQQHFVYSVLRPSIRKRALAQSLATSIVGTGRHLQSLLFPADYSFLLQIYDLSDLWAVVDGTRFRVEDKSSGRSIPLYRAGQQSLALSPNGRSVVTALPVSTIPSIWEALYLPPLPYSNIRIKTGQQDLEAFAGSAYVSEYGLIDLFSGKVRSLTRAPTGSSVGWSGAQRPAWSDDSQWVALPNTFVSSNSQEFNSHPDRPCVAVVNVLKGQPSCVERLTSRTKDGEFEKDWHYINSVRFAPSKSTRLTVTFMLRDFLTKGSTEYITSDDGYWKPNTTPTESVKQDRPLNISIEEGLNDPPVLVATDRATNTRSVILDPNSQLKDVDLGEASVFRWKDKTGRDWVGGLYKPPDYVPGQRYPLVVQTHGFYQNAFLPSGSFPTGFAARELAGEGILVLQAPDCPVLVTPGEASCNAAGYEAAVEQLVVEGLVDPNRVGIAGFSRSCYYVLETLTRGAQHFKAASITDGVNYGYLQYLTMVDGPGGATYSGEANTIIGSPPFGDGLQLWLKRSPGFNLDKVTTPLQVVSVGRMGVIAMWEPYAALRYLNKPVDLVVLTGGTHPLTNPADRMVSQGGIVDWFRFWLKGEEDPNPAKAEQYKRWRELRKLQELDSTRPQ